MSDSEGVDFDDEESISLIIDNGSYSIRAGVGMDDKPQIILQNENGFYINHKKKSSNDSNKNIEKYIWPIKRGIIRDFNIMEKIWKAIFDQLKVLAEEHPVFLTECISNNKNNREKTVQIMFEKFNCPATYLGNQAVYSLYGSGGGLTGLAIDCGYEQIRIVDVYEGYAQLDSVQTDYGGKQCSEYLEKLLKDKLLNKNYEIDDIRKIKETQCHIAIDYDLELKRIFDDARYIISGYLRKNVDVNYSNYTATNIENICYEYCNKFDDLEYLDKILEYQLPDGSVIKLEHERFQCTEFLFDPSLIGSDENTLPKLVQRIIGDGPWYGPSPWENIVLCGGSSLFPCLQQRLRTELTALAPRRYKVKVASPPGRQNVAWMGASIMSCLSTFSEIWITKDEYDECGVNIVHRKCF